MEPNFISLLDRSGPLSAGEKAALADAVARTIDVDAQQDIIREGELSPDSPVLLSGFACRYKLFPEGERQIVSFHLPGDFCDLHNLFNPSDHNVRAIVPSTFALIPRGRLLELIDDYPALGRALWRSTLRDAAIFRERMAWIGRQDAYARLAHLFCELMIRANDAGTANGTSFPMPATQMELADALGLSYVHINRVLQRLRAGELISLEHRIASVRDWDRLVAAANFNPAYLQFHTGRIEMKMANDGRSRSDISNKNKKLPPLAEIAG